MPVVYLLRTSMQGNLKDHTSAITPQDVNEANPEEPCQCYISSVCQGRVTLKNHGNLVNVNEVFVQIGLRLTFPL